MAETAQDEDLLLKSFFADPAKSRGTTRILSCFKLNPFECLNLPFDASPADVKRHYRKAKEAFGVLAKEQQLLLDEWEQDYILTQVNVAKEEGGLKKDEEAAKEMWKRKPEHEEQWKVTREQRVSSWRDFMKSGKKGKKGKTRLPKLKMEDPNKSYVERPVKRV